MQLKNAIILLLVSVCQWSYATATPLNADDMLKKVDSVRSPGDNFSFDIRVSQYDDAELNSEFTFNVRVKDHYKSLVSYTSPASSVGKRILMVGDNMWIYIPRTRIPIRISAQQKVSSGVSNADVARVVYSLDYQATEFVKESLDNKSVYALSLLAKTKGAAYQKMTLWVSADDYRPLKATLYTTTGRKLKTLAYKDYQMVLGRLRPMLLEIVDEINSNERVLIAYSNMVLSDTPESHFQKHYLPKLKQ